jgi:ABC-type multidrug transport system ATPase subunit
MKVKSIKFLKDYRQFKKDQTVTFSSSDQLKSKFLDINVSVVVGRNGSGKTTLISLIPKLFHHLERYNGKIPADFELSYSIKIFKTWFDVIISHKANLVRISVNDKYNQVQLLPDKGPNQPDNALINAGEASVRFRDIQQYLPSSVVTSVFSIHGEYPAQRPKNYQGTRTLANVSTELIYGTNHYSIGSISRGILRFLRKYHAQRNKVRKLLKLFDLEFTGRVYRQDPHGEGSWVLGNRQWLNEQDVNVQMEDYFLNDLEFRRDGRLIVLNNMSSGEKMLLLRAISILTHLEKNSIILIEEPELHLDQVWNHQLITLFNELYKDYNPHIILTTHDYSIINSVQNQNLILMNRGREQPINGTFLASYDELFNLLYGSKLKPNSIENGILKELETQSLENLKEVYETLGNSFYKYLIFKRINELEDVENH